MPKKSASKEPALPAAPAWLSDDAAQQAWMDKVDLARRLDEGDGFARVENFLPTDVAEWLLETLKALPEAAWEPTGAAERDDSGYEDSIKHHFSLCEVEEDDALLMAPRAIWRAWEPSTSLPNITAARYGASDHIAPHDDLVLEDYVWPEARELARTYDPEGFAKDGRSFGLSKWKGPRRFTRKIALVYYLNKGWKAEDGGSFVDLQTDESYLPEFNTLVAFTVPRMHMVSAVTNVNAKRYSLFGWWLQADELEKMAEPAKPKKASKGKSKANGAALAKRPAAQAAGGTKKGAGKVKATAAKKKSAAAPAPGKKKAATKKGAKRK
eukprot:TRINITY_DN47129_c0_g1_i1.p1 TRINITY_DN47129_c0_g1~~TRINITY_DN47129_c0_g1_i1.p1  ORF type:complete len:325 (-),score=120.19 TRINITY_DN47129_c0_g1_i1:105-1079(-)